MALWAIALAWLTAHLPFLARSLEDIDSINFALGLHQFAPALDQPHPPGYPVFIAMGKASLAVVHAVAPSLPPIRADALALAVWSAIAGAIALVAAASLFRSVSAHDDMPLAEWSAALLAAAPLFWMTGLRPMSDMSGLAATLAAQALLVRGAKSRDALVAGAAVAGLAAGIRSQAVWLTLPLLLFSLVAQRRAGLAWILTRPVAGYVVAALVWAIPLVAASGGVAGYLRALQSQAAQDFSGVDMLWTHPTPRHLAFDLYRTFVLPWASPPLAVAVGIAAAAGLLVLLLRDRRALLLLVIAFVPYTVLHLVFQETVTVRYALPVVVPVVYLAMRGVALLHRAGIVLAAAGVAAALVVAVPGGVAYGREIHPAFAAIADMMRAAERRPPAAVYAHVAERRALQTVAARSLPLAPAVVPGNEWRGPEDYWTAGGGAQAWFLANPLRTDLALIDPESRRDVTRYTWRVADRPELSGTRPAGVDWYRLDPPGWFAGEGWSLTPETAGVALASGKGIDQGRPIEAFVRRRQEPTNVVIAGRHDGGPVDTVVRFDVAIDGRPAASWPVDLSATQNFVQVLHLPDGIPAGAGGYARLAVTARPAREGQAMPEMQVDQFNIQPARVLMYALADGWYAAEYDNTTGLSWRWTGERSVVQIVPPQAARLVLRGESPLKYFDAPPILRVTAGAKVIAELRPSADFEWRVDVPAADVLSANGRIAITTDRVYLPGPAEGTADTRRLGVRLFSIDVNPVNR